MKIRNEVKVTAGQIVKDLELIVKNNPTAIPTYSLALGPDAYIRGVRFLKNGLLLLEGAGEDEEDIALSAEGLLEILKEKPASSKVVIDYGWQLLNLLPVDGEAIFSCDEDDDFINLYCCPTDIRLCSYTRWREDLKRFAEKYPNRKIVFWDDNGEAYYVNALSTGGEEFFSVYYTDDEEDDCRKGEDCLTVSSFLDDEVTESNIGVCVAYYLGEDDDYILKAVEVGEDGHIFFEDEVDGEEVIACRLGETVRDPEDWGVVYDEDEDEDDEDWDEDEEDEDWDEDEDEDEDDEDEDEEDDDDEDDDDEDDEEFKVVNGKCVFPEGITEIEDDAFSAERSIEHVEIPESVEVIGEAAFSFCRSLKTVKICGPLKKIKAEAFLNCRRLISINIPDTVTRIGSEAFSGCDSLGFIVIPDSVKAIGEDAFSECETLKKIFIRNPELLEDTGIDDDVQIVTDFDEKDIPDITLRPARKYIFQYAINAKVGQLIEDLKSIDSENPESHVGSTTPNANDFYIKGVRLWNDILILNVCWDEDEAISVDDLLDELSEYSEYDEATPVLVGMDWKLLNFGVEEDGSILRYDDDSECTYFDYEHDVRSFEPGDLNHLLKDFAERYPDRKIMCKIAEGSYFPVTDVYEDDFIVYIHIKKDGECITVSDFADNMGGDEIEVLFFDGLSKMGIEKTILADNGPVFFEDKVDGEDVIAFRLGETLYDSRAEDDEDEDFWNDDDTVVTIDDLRDGEEKQQEEENNSADEKKNSESEEIPVFSKDDFIPSGNAEGHEYVDLGLPSGLKWATCNIGASSPEEYGDYFAWGETTPKKVYSEDSYDLSVKEYDEEAMEYMDEDEDEDYYSYYEMVKYGNDDIEDGKEGWERNLNPEDDAATVNWKGIWRMPTEDENQELIDNCELIWGTINNTLGVKVKGPNGHCIFLPATGSKWNEKLEYEDECNYWSSSLNDSYEICNGTEHTDYYDASYLLFIENEKSCSSCVRNAGLPIRPVCIINKDEDVESAGKNPEVEVEAKSEKFDNEKLKASVHKAIQEINAAKKGDITLKLVSYSGSVIKMMTALSSIEGIDEDSAFNKLQKLPAVILEGISAKKAMQVGAMLEEAGATVSIENEAESRAKEEAERKAKEEAERKAKEEAERKAKEEAERKAKEEAERKAKEEAERKAKEEAERKAKEEAKRKKEEEALPYVDLGLSVKWAKCNLGASKPEQFGNLFAWGETQPKAEYERGNYKFGKEKPFSKYQPKMDVVVKHLLKADEHLTKGDDKTTLDLCDDAANVNLGGKWRIPTCAEIEELINNCTWIYENFNGEHGFKVMSNKKGYTDKWIFLPIEKPYINHLTFYASSSLDEDCAFYSVLMSHPHGATHFGDICTNLDLEKFIICRFAGTLIRPVTK